MTRKILSVALLSLGVLAMLFGFLFYASNAIPYQDATPKLLTHQSAQGTEAVVIFLLGAASAATGAVMLWLSVRTKRRMKGGR